jgi:hypothetical protein
MHSDLPLASSPGLAAFVAAACKLDDGQLAPELDARAHDLIVAAIWDKNRSRRPS